MFEIKSYLKKEGERKNECTFIDISDILGAKKISKLIDLNYIEGAIIIKYYSDYVLDFSYYDYIDQLWSYIFDLVENYVVNKTSSVNFPDQPINLLMSKIDDNRNYFIINSKNRKRTYVFQTKDFVNAIISGYEEFCICFEKIFSISMKNEYQRIRILKLNMNKNMY